MAKTNLNEELFKAVYSGDLSVAKKLVSQGADVNYAEEKTGITALHTAVVSENPELVEFLSDSGANMDAADIHGQSPRDYANKIELKKSQELLKAIYSEDMPLATKLLGEGANVNYAEEKTGITALHAAVASDNQDLVKLLISNGADITAEDVHGLSPRDYTDKIAIKKGEEILTAAFSGDLDSVKEFVNDGINIDYIDERTGATVLHAAVASENIEIVSYLVNAGANPNIKDKQGLTAIDYIQAKVKSEQVDKSVVVDKEQAVAQFEHIPKDVLLQASKAAEPALKVGARSASPVAIDDERVIEGQNSVTKTGVASRTQKNSSARNR